MIWTLNVSGFSENREYHDGCLSGSINQDDGGSNILRLFKSRALLHLHNAWLKIQWISKNDISRTNYKLTSPHNKTIHYPAESIQWTSTNAHSLLHYSNWWNKMKPTFKSVKRTKAIDNNNNIGRRRHFALIPVYSVTDSPLVHWSGFENHKLIIDQYTDIYASFILHNVVENKK